MTDKLKESQEILNAAIAEFNPKAILVMFSGGNDSLAAYYTSKILLPSIDGIVHVNTRTGIPETTQFCRKFASKNDEQYFEYDDKDIYEQRVLERGFYGIGRSAHAFVYHVLKATAFRKIISRNFRKRRRNYNVLMINGARSSESTNRSKHIDEWWNIDPAAKGNIWVNIILNWTKAERDNFLDDTKANRNPVTELLCRSGECMCGTMQTMEQRKEAAFFFPHWGKWINDLEQRVLERGFKFGWGESFVGKRKRKVSSEMEFQPACMNCLNGSDIKSVESSV